MKSKVFNFRQIIFLTLFLLCICPINALKFEKGDGVFRAYDAFFDLYDVPYTPWPGHAAMYLNFLKYPPTESWDQRIIEMQSSGLVLYHTMQHWINAVGEGDIWGVRTIPTLTASNRRDLIYYASKFKDAEYDFTNGYKNPDPNNPTFRCDGLIEYAYEVVLGETGPEGSNGGIVPGDTKETLSPLAMYNSDRWFTRLQGVPPIITIKDEQGDEIKVGDVTKDIEIKIEVTDGNYGSGIGLLQIKNTQKAFLKEIKDDYDVSHIYLASEIGELPEGDIIVEAYDQAGNSATTGFTTEFTIDRTPPLLSAHSISPLYDNFRGTTTLNPSTLERTHYLEFSDEGSGISSIIVSGPDEDLINWTFYPPVVSTDAYLTDMATGQYEIKAVDAVGNETIAPFRIGSLEISVSTPSSAIYDYTFHSTEENPYWIEYGCKIAINGVSSISLDRIELFEIVPSEAEPRIIKSSQIAEVLSSTTVVFDLGISSSIYSYDSPDYLAKVWDTGGNAVQTIFNLRPDSQATSSSEGVYTNTYLSPHNNICLQADAREGNFTSNPIDIYSNENLIPGVVFPHIYKLPYGIIQNPFFVTWTNPKGDLPTLFNISIGDRQDIGDVELYLRTGDEEDVSDGEFIQIAKRHYFFADGENIPEENCSCSFQHPCICYTEQSYPNRVIPLKQYAQSKLVLKNPPPSSVVRQMCDPSDSEGMCPQGYEVKSCPTQDEPEIKSVSNINEPENGLIAPFA